MNYADYSSPKVGYEPYARPQGSYGQLDETSLSASPTSGSKKESFSELVVTNGVGDYHINHFIAFSDFVASATFITGAQKQHDHARELTRQLYQHFAEWFSAWNIAKVTERSNKHLFNGHPTFEFELKGWRAQELVAGLLHSDWVAMQVSSNKDSFYASTLKRDWKLASETIALKLLMGVNRAAGEVMVWINQHHALAGRRSWKVGFDELLNRYYVETVTLERNSTFATNLLEKTGWPREVVQIVWSKLIENAVTKMNSDSITWIPSSSLTDDVRNTYFNYYQGGKHVLYRIESVGTYPEAKKLPWFVRVLDRHPELTMGLSMPQ